MAYDIRWRHDCNLPRSATLHLAPMLAFAVCAAATTRAHAHGFGQRYELPLPLSLYLFGAVTAVALSFVVLALFVRGAQGTSARRGRDLLASPLGRLLARPACIWSVRLAALVVFIVTVLAGLVGNQNPYRNIAPTLVWIIWWVGLAYVAALVGDLWRLINPWSTVFAAAELLARRLAGRDGLSLRLPYPAMLGVWPACLLLIAFAGIEFVYPHAAAPAHIAWLAIAYSILTWAGMLAFGRDTWLEHGEVFSLVFATFARFAPTEASAGRLVLRRFGAGLVENQPVSTSMLAFVLLLLASVLYDGLIGTGEWAMLEAAARPLFPGPITWADTALKIIGLPILWLLFLAAYLGVSAIMSMLAGGGLSTLEIARRFALTLVPIAIGYHVAHYLEFLLVQGQYIIPLLSDPFGFGWNLFGTAGYRVDIGLVGARFAWYATVASIVIGHVVAVYLAHVTGAALIDATGTALRTLAPLTALMVIYTAIGLSIAAQPIVEIRAAGEPAAVVGESVVVPPDAVLPRPPDGRLEASGPDKTARAKLTYKVLGSAFHDTTRTTFSDLLYAYAFAYRWGIHGGDRYDPFIDAATASLRRHLVAVRPVGVDAGAKSFRVGDVDFVREVLTIEVYLDIAPDDADWNALVAPPWSTLPWHVLVLMEEAVARGWAAFSEAEAVRRGVPWLDLVRARDQSAKLASLVATFERDAYRPQTLQAHVSAEEARRRWAALAAFYKANGHFLVTNGPYRLKSWTAESATLEAFRDLTYPLGVGSYDAYAIPRRGFVTMVDWDGQRLTLSGDIEISEKFQRSHRLVRTPLQSAAAPVLTRAAPECRYVVTGTDGRVAMAGVAPLGSDRSFQIDVPRRLPPGRYTLSTLIAVNGNVMHAEVHRTEFIMGSRP